MKCSICQTGDLYTDPKTGLLGCQKCDKAQSATLEDFLIHFGNCQGRYGQLLLMVAQIANRPLSGPECHQLVDWLCATLLTEIAKCEKAAIAVIDKHQNKHMNTGEIL